MLQEKSTLYDVNEVRNHARQSLDKGSVTQDYPLDLERTYKLLNEALSTEILCILRYRHHQIIAKGIDFPQVSAQFAEHARDEEKHALMIATRIDQLGGNPDMSPAAIGQQAVTDYGDGRSLSEMIKQDLIAERMVIEIYRRLIEYFGAADSTSRRIFEKILEDEEEHATDLADLLATMEPHPGRAVS
jgi:bacterioferritin